MMSLNVFDSIAKFFSNLFTALSSVLARFTWKDAIDILLLAILIYALIRLIRETRAAQLIKGLMILLLMYLLSTTLNLFIMSTLFSYFFQFTWVALLIVFQPEIRSALERMGRSKMGRTLSISNIVGLRTEEDEELLNLHSAINAVVAVAAQFQRDKVGALIVFERETKLGEVIGTGTVINAAPSAPLIGNIFFNKAPLHDGAMVIRDGMVYAAGCILPLTSRDDVNYELGTRHRAAIGLSENSDAVIVIVSEETGQISIACNGVLTRDFTRETLSAELQKLLINPSGNEERRGLWRVKNGKK